MLAPACPGSRRQLQESGAVQLRVYQSITCGKTKLDAACGSDELFEWKRSAENREEIYEAVPTLAAPVLVWSRSRAMVHPTGRPSRRKKERARAQAGGLFSFFAI